MNGNHFKVSLQKKRVLDLKCFMYKTFTVSGKLTLTYTVLLVTAMIEETRERRS